MRLSLVAVDLSKHINLNNGALSEKPTKYYFEGEYEGEKFNYVYSKKNDWEIFRVNENCKMYVNDRCVFFRYIYSFGYEESLEDLISVNEVNTDLLLTYLESNCDDNEEIFLSIIFGIPLEKKKGNMSEFVEHIETEYKSKLSGCSFNFVKYVKDNKLYEATKNFVKKYGEKNHLNVVVGGSGVHPKQK